jgi:hypothetical protein
VFPDDDHAIHREVVPAEAQRLADALVDGNAELFGPRAGEISVRELIDIERG